MQMDADLVKAIAAFFGAVTAIGGVITTIAARLGKTPAKDLERKVPESECMKESPVSEPKMPAPGRVQSVLEEWTRDDEVADLRTRLRTLDVELRRSKAEQARTALALAEERDQAEANLSRKSEELNAAEQREQALRLELAELRRTIDSGYTRVPLPAVRAAKRVVEVDAREIHDIPTPTQGRARVRPTGKRRFE